VISIGKSLRLVLFPALLLVAGCGGLSASRSISPLDFFLPGLLQADPPALPSNPEFPVQQPAMLVAQN
jgi:hypothetical protein